MNELESFLILLNKYNVSEITLKLNNVSKPEQTETLSPKSNILDQIDSFVNEEEESFNEDEESNMFAAVGVKVEIKE